jgi:hypothetical protein
MWSLEVFLNRLRPKVDGPVRWAVHLKGAGDHVLENDGTQWRWLAGDSRGDVVITTTVRRWATLLFNLQDGRVSAAGDFSIAGDPDRVREFMALAQIR